MDLIDECRRGNRDAMRDLFVMHQRRVYSIALNFFGGEASRADDVTQQVFLKVFTKNDVSRQFGIYYLALSDDGKYLHRRDAEGASAFWPYGLVRGGRPGGEILDRGQDRVW